MADKTCDIVLEGGGVKGIALVGALRELDKAGYQHCRVAGTSAGAVVGSLLAAGMPFEDIDRLMRAVDYPAFRDESFLSRFSVPGKIASVLFTKGIYRGDYLENWLAAQLDKFGVRTFADLKAGHDDLWAKDLPPERRYKLVVIVSDVSRGQLVRLPWDYHEYGLDPDKQTVASAVRASMSIPYYYQPSKLRRRFLVDGGLLSNFPLDIFDAAGDWPTFGVKLSAKADALSKMNPVTNSLNYGLAILSTAMGAHDQMHLDQPAAQARTVFVDTFGIRATDFEISNEQQEALYESGRQAARTFLKSWDFAEYKRQFPLVRRGGS